MKNYFNKPIGILILFLCCAQWVSAHTINYALEGKPFGYVFSYYLQLGFEHIIPNGFDHILFIVSLYLLSPKLKNVLWQATAFTIAHTLTLILSMRGLIIAPPAIIEPIIALSIFFVALENVFSYHQLALSDDQANNRNSELTVKNSSLLKRRIALVFLFGLVHGMGFASSLNEIGLPPNAFFSSLITFNIGVELGQVTIILLCYFAFGRWFSEKTWYQSRIVVPISVCIAIIAGFWTVQRLIG